MRPCPEFYGNDALPVSIKAQEPARQPAEPAGITRTPGAAASAVVSATNSGMAHTLARGLRIDQVFPANQHFCQQPSNPRAEVRLLPGPFRPAWLRANPHSSVVRRAGRYRETPRTAYTGAYTVSTWSAALAGARIGNVAESYYAARSRRDPSGTCRRSRRPSSASEPAGETALPKRANVAAQCQSAFMPSGLGGLGLGPARARGNRGFSPPRGRRRRRPASCRSGGEGFEAASC